jgi:hypothetical protein
MNRKYMSVTVRFIHKAWLLRNAVPVVTKPSQRVPVPQLHGYDDIRLV